MLRRAADSWWLIGVLAVLFVAGFAGSTFAYFDGTVTETATYAGGTVGAPLAPAATASGYDGVVTWSPPATITTTYSLPTTTYAVTTQPGVQGQRVVMMDNGASTDCSAVTYTSTVATGLAPTASVYTDSNRTATTGAGDRYCYAVESYWTPISWYTTARAGVAQLGLVVDSVVIANGTGTPAKLDAGDTITLTFNQQPATPANATICTFHTGGLIIIGDSACSAATDAYLIGELSGYTVGGVGHQKRSATVSVAGDVMTVTVSQSGQNVSGSGTFAPSTSLASAATIDPATVCQAAPCIPVPTGGF